MALPKVLGEASVDGVMGSSVASVTGAVERQAVRLPMGRPAMPGPVSRELLWAQLAHLTST